nr:MAG TPA: hypothetical protein [Caudoviricetes sp.]
MRAHIPPYLRVYTRACACVSQLDKLGGDAAKKMGGY